ncbi:radical SAM protein [bacterium]|nr:radical SAM protein [bacterium]
MISSFWLVLDYDCNNRCNFCYTKSKNFIKKSMDKRYAEEIIDSMKNSGAKQCLLIGGEPTLYKDLEHVIQYIKNSGLKSVLITNGRKLSNLDYVRKLKLVGIDRIVISIESSNEKKHNKMTNCYSFKETVEGIENCIKEKINFCTLTTINYYNYKDCFELINFLENLGVYNIAFNCAIPSPVDKIEKSLSPIELAKSIEEIFYSSEFSKARINFNGTIPLCLLSENARNKLVDQKSLDVGCQMYYGKGAAFDPEGNVLPCTHFTNYPILENCCQDNKFIYKNNFLDIWKNEMGVPCSFRKKLWRYPVEVCSRCDYWGACVGGCPLFWKHFNPKEYIVKPLKMKGG